MFRKIARPMLASVYVADGIDTLINTDEHVEGGQAVLERTKAVLPANYAAVIPDNPALVVRAVGATRVAAGSLLAIGKFQRLSAAALAATAVPTILARHAFWNAEDEDEKASRRNGFLTNVALLGGLLITVSDTQGKPDLAWRTKHAAKVTNKKVQSALPGKSDTEKYLDQGKEKAGEYAGAAKAAAATGAATAQAKATGFWEDKGRDLYEAAQDKAGEWLGEAEDYLDEGSKAARKYYERAHDYIEDNKDDWLSFADDNARAAKDRTVKAAKKAQERADEAAAKAVDEYGNYSKKAGKTSRKAAKKAAKTRAKAIKRLKKKFNL